MGKVNVFSSKLLVGLLLPLELTNIHTLLKHGTAVSEDTTNQLSRDTTEMFVRLFTKRGFENPLFN